MLNLIVAILCSVLVGILIKFARQKQIMIAQSIAVNYLVASGLCYFILNPDFNHQTLVEIVANNPASYLFVLLGILLPLVFLIQAKSLENAGIIRTDIAQRLSLFLPVIASFLLFGEMVTLAKIMAILLAFIALACLLWKGKQNLVDSPITFLSLGLVWFGFGIIDILFKQVAKLGQAFPLTLFIAFVFAGCLMFMLLFLKRTQWHIPSVAVGLLLGGLNFGNILFYIQAHQVMKDDPTFVFTGMNLGVILLGTFSGLIFFNEKMNRINYIGVIIAIIAILCLFYWR